MENKKLPHCRKNSNSNIKIVERGNIHIPNTRIHDRSLSCNDTDTSIKIDGVKPIVWVQTSTLSEMMWSCKCFPRVSKMPSTAYCLEWCE